MINNTTLSEISSIIKESQRIIIICHVRPDGDTLGCAYALKSVLEDMGKNVICTSSDAVSARLAFICDTPTLLPCDIPSDFCADLVMSVDVASISMLGNCYPLLSLAKSIKIDHHISDEAFATYNYSEPDSASCSEIIFDLIDMLTPVMSMRVCELLYTGISFDTGCFKHSNVTPGTHTKASYLISRGVDSAKINSALFANKTQKELRALKLAYNSLEYYADGKIAVVCISNKEKAENGLDDDDLADLSQIPIEIDGVLLGITLKEKGDVPTHFKVSMRSRPGVDAGSICRKLNGGGHTCAAGGLIIANGRDMAKDIAVKCAIEELGF